MVRLAVLLGVEYGFNVFPATPISSAVLQVRRMHHTTRRLETCLYLSFLGPSLPLYWACRYLQLNLNTVL